MPVVRKALVALGVAGLLAACASGSDLAPRAQRQLESGLDQLRAAVAAADRAEARSALRELERLVGSLAGDAQIDDARAQEILDAAAGVAEQLSLLPATSPSQSPEPTETAAPPTPTGDEDEDEDGGGHGNAGNGNGNGNAYGHEQGGGGGKD